MFKTLLLVSALALLSGGSALAATAGSPTTPAPAAAPQPNTAVLRDLLTQGYDIKSMTIIPQEVARRMANSDQWADDLMITLQHGVTLAICHVRLDSTLTGGTGFLDITCVVDK